MNCANHSERTATAFCQNCGKALCPECIRNADGLVLCEPCLLARAAARGNTSQWGASPVGSVPPAAGFRPVGGSANAPVSAGGYPQYARAYPPGSPSPVLAGLLGVIPGVGAMYNGQFVKALVHVLVFIVLIGMTQHFGLAGFLIAAWVFYQIFDAAQTASARRDGRSLPDPLGILDFSQRVGPHRPPAAASVAAGASIGATPVQQQAAWQSMPPEGFALYRRSEPVGAIVLIAVGSLFLLSTLGVFRFDWVARGWPVILLVIGVWLLIRRSTRPAGGQMVYPAAATVPGPQAGWSPSEPAPTATPEQSADANREEENR